jgi:hypothetical protein
MTRQRTRPVVSHLSGHTLSEGSAPSTAHVVLCYASRDPYAVIITVVSTDREPIVCFLARDLLTDGLSWPVGTGEVTVEPRPDDNIRVTMRARQHCAVLELRHGDVAAFLDDTFTIVPPGSESLHLDIERLVDELLGS